MSPEQILINGIILAIAGSMINRWMNQVDKRIETVENRIGNLETNIQKIMIKLNIQVDDDSSN